MKTINFINMRTINKYLLSAIILSVTTTLFTSCDDDGDTTPPSITLLAPSNETNLQIGKDIHFEAELSDDVMLHSYKIEIHNNFDGHDHGNTYSSGTTAFSFQKSWDISDKKNTTIHHHEILIPENATPGNYHFIIYCTDAAGNESHMACNIVLTHEEVDNDHELRIFAKQELPNSSCSKDLPEELLPKFHQ